MVRKVTTNNVPRDSASFFRYRGELYELYDLLQFTRFHEASEGPRMPHDLAEWDGYMSDSAFSATVVRYATDDMGDTCVVVVYVTS
jgi:hypothetical protein